MSYIQKQKKRYKLTIDTLSLKPSHFARYYASRMLGSNNY